MGSLFLVGMIAETHSLAVYENATYVAGATTTGIFVGVKDGAAGESILSGLCIEFHLDSSSHPAFHSVLPVTGVDQLVCVPDVHSLIVLHGGTLSELPMDSLMSSNQRSPLSTGTAMPLPLSDPSDGFVSAVCAGVVNGCSTGMSPSQYNIPFGVKSYVGTVAFIAKHRVRKRVHTFIHDFTSKSLRRYGEVRCSINLIPICQAYSFCCSSRPRYRTQFKTFRLFPV